MFRAAHTRILSASFIALALAAAGCASSGGGTSAPGGGSSGGSATQDTLVIANAVKVDTLDPEANSVNESIWMDQNLYSRLLQPNANGTGLLPDLATSWTIAKNGLTYTFHLRPEAKFSGGWGFLLTAVKNITAPDAHTVVVTLSQPHAPLLADLVDGVGARQQFRTKIHRGSSGDIFLALYRRQGGVSDGRAACAGPA